MAGRLNRSGMLTIGLTGGIGSGKSAAAEMFAELGAPVVDADVAAREVVAPGEPALVEIGRHFGNTLILEDGNLDRRALRGIVFSDPAEKAWLEQLLHPLIRRRIVASLAALDAPYALLVSPLLLETDQAQLVDRVLLIDCDPDIQVARVRARDQADEEQVRAIMATQMSRSARRARADDVIENNAGLEEMRRLVAAQHARYLELSAA